MPALNEIDSCSQMFSSRGLVKQAKAHTLHTAVGNLQPLFQGLHTGSQLQLSADLQAIVASSPNGTRRAVNPAMQMADAATLLRQHLARHSPLAQGKTDDADEHSRSGESVFSLKQRTMRVDSILAPGHAIVAHQSLNSAQVRRAVMSLRRTMLDYYDALGVYESYWSTVHFNLAASGSEYLVDRLSRTITLPVDFHTERFVAWFTQMLPSLLEDAHRRVQQRQQSTPNRTATRQW
jgi:hypothetical protein